MGKPQKYHTSKYFETHYLLSLSIALTLLNTNGQFIFVQDTYCLFFEFSKMTFLDLNFCKLFESQLHLIIKFFARKNAM